MVPKNTICLWFDGTALDAAQFYAQTFPDSAVTAAHRGPGDYSKWGLSRQITPRALIAAITDPDPAAAKRAFAAMMQMTKIDIEIGRAHV